MNRVKCKGKLKRKQTPKMDEASVAARVAQNKPEGYVAPVHAPSVPEPILDGSTIEAPNELDEMTQYKLHEYFNIPYRTTNDTAKQQAQFIFERVAAMVGEPSYGFVIAKIRDLEGIIGTQNSDNRMYRLYQWLKLEGVRRDIDAQMGAISG